MLPYGGMQDVLREESISRIPSRWLATAVSWANRSTSWPARRQALALIGKAYI